MFCECRATSQIFQWLWSAQIGILFSWIKCKKKSSLSLRGITLEITKINGHWIWMVPLMKELAWTMTNPEYKMKKQIVSRPWELDVNSMFIYSGLFISRLWNQGLRLKKKIVPTWPKASTELRQPVSLQSTFLCVSPVEKFRSIYSY